MTIITKGMGAVKQIYSKLAKTKTKSKAEQKFDNVYKKDPTGKKDIYIKKLNERIKKSVIYTVLGVDKFANKSIIGFYPFFGHENKTTWMEVFQDLINRGLKRVLMFISDDF